MRRVALIGLLAGSACYGGKIDPNGSLAAGSTGMVDEDSDADGGEMAAESDGDGGGSTGESEPAPPDLPGSTGGAVGGDSESGGDDGASTGDASDSSGGEPAVGCDAFDEALLCEDFDDALDSGQWDVVELNGGTVAVEDGLMHVTLGSADGAHGFIRLQAGEVFPVADNHFFGRVRMRIEPQVPVNHSYIISAWGTLDGSTARYRLDVNGGTLNSRYTHATVEQHGGWRKLGRDAEPEVWACVEWEYDGASDSMRYWFDGELDLEMEVDGAVEDPTWVAPEFERFEIGYHTYQAAENGDAFDIWFDDLVLATDRVGC
ncbi:MAG: hypothetical protein AAF721_13020 [Myxococcota bacterium]